MTLLHYVQLGVQILIFQKCYVADEELVEVVDDPPEVYKNQIIAVTIQQYSMFSQSRISTL